MVLRGLNPVQMRSFSDILFGTKNLWLEIFTRRTMVQNQRFLFFRPAAKSICHDLKTQICFLCKYLAVSAETAKKENLRKAGCAPVMNV